MKIVHRPSKADDAQPPRRTWLIKPGTIAYNDERYWRLTEDWAGYKEWEPYYPLNKQEADRLAEALRKTEQGGFWSLFR
jgi:hypothetical protein